MKKILKRIFNYIYCLVLRLRNNFRKRRLGIRGNVSLGKNVTREGCGDLVIGNYTRIGDNCSFCFNPVSGNRPKIIIGSGCRIQKFNDFGCSKEIIIEDNVNIAPYVHYTDRNHNFEDVMRPIMDQPTSIKGPIHICSGTWIGFGAQIMSGVTIGRHCVIAAGAIVTKDVPDFCIVGGNPARIIKRYNCDTKKWEKV